MTIAHIYNAVSAENGTKLSASLWFIPPADGSDAPNFQAAHLFNCETNDANLYNRIQCWADTTLVGGVTPTRTLSLSLSNFDFNMGLNDSLLIQTLASSYTPGSWHHVLFGGDTAVEANGYCIVNAVNKTDFSSIGGSAGFTATWNGCVFGIPTTPAEAAFHDTKVQMAEVQIWFGTYIDPTADNLAKFVKIVNGIGKPQDPVVAAAAFGTPTYSFRGNNTQFPTNHGNGGAMSSSGVINSYTPVPGA